MRESIGWIAALLVQLGISGASAQTPPATTGMPAAMKVQLQALADRLVDPNSIISISASLAELDTIEPHTATDSVERGRVDHLRALVEWKAQRPDESIGHYAAALQIDAKTPFLSADERILANYNAAKQAEKNGECKTALPFYQSAAALMAQASSYSESQRLGVQESIGYCLHELRRFEEARQVNTAVLASGERLFGVADPKLLSVLINLAQNDYELHRPADARAGLQRVLAIATQAGDAEHVNVALFQLGVLAFETGQPDEARRYMTQRLRLAKEAGDSARIHRAQDDLDVLEDKLVAR
jgi:tetratricopeptide (TPR) repeat protein